MKTLFEFFQSMNESEFDAFDVLFTKGLEGAGWLTDITKDFAKGYWEDIKKRREEDKESREELMKSLSDKERDQYEKFEKEEDEFLKGLEDANKKQSEVNTLRKQYKKETNEKKKNKIEDELMVAEKELGQMKGSLKAKATTVKKNHERLTNIRSEYDKAKGNKKSKSTSEVSNVEKQKDTKEIIKLAKQLSSADDSEKKSLIKKAKEKLGKIKQKYNIDIKKSSDEAPKTKKEIEKSITNTQKNISNWTTELGKLKNKKTKTAQELQNQISRGNEKINKYNKELKTIGESFTIFYRKLVEDELENAIKDLEQAMEPSPTQATPENSEQGDELKQALDDLEDTVASSETQEIPETPGEIPSELELTSQPYDPMTQQQLPEPPEDIDYTLKPFSEKQNMIITFLKENGFTNFDVKINNGENHIIVNGNIDNDVRTDIKSLAEDIEIVVEFEDIELEGDRHKTKIIIRNKMTLQKFMDVYKIIQRQRSEKKQENQALGI